MSVVARVSTTTSRGETPPAISSPTRAASALASATRQGAASPSAAHSPPLAIAQLLVVAQEVAAQKLKVLEVERRALALALLVASAKAREQPIKQRRHALGPPVRRCRAEPGQRLAVCDTHRGRQRGA